MNDQDTKYVVLQRNKGNEQPCYEVWKEDDNEIPDYSKLRNLPPTHPVVFMDKYEIAQAVAEWDEGLDASDPDYPSNLYDMMQRTVTRHTIIGGGPFNKATALSFMDQPEDGIASLLSHLTGIPIGVLGAIMGSPAHFEHEVSDDEDDEDGEDGFMGTASLLGAKRLLEITEVLEKFFAVKATIPAKRKRAISNNAAEIEKAKAEYEGLLKIQLGGRTLDEYKEVVCSTCDCPQCECPILPILNDAQARMKILFPEG